MHEIIKAAKIIKTGGIVAFPTETAYGLAASIFYQDSLDRIYQIKKRDVDKPLLVLIPDTSHLDILASHVPEIAHELIKNFWPGPLTILFPAKNGLPWQVTGKTNKVGARISPHPVAQALLKEVGHPITATSANVSGKDFCISADEVRRHLVDPPPDYILNGGITPGGKPSTIIDITTIPPKIIREGVIPKEEIEKKLKIKIA